MPPQDWDHTADVAEVLDLFADFHFDFLDLPALFRGVQTVYKYPMVDRDPLPRWDFGRVTLLGDAAHPMYPTGANGASQAILDARVLARELVLQRSKRRWPPTQRNGGRPRRRWYGRTGKAARCGRCGWSTSERPTGSCGSRTC